MIKSKLDIKLILCTIYVKLILGAYRKMLKTILTRRKKSAEAEKLREDIVVLLFGKQHPQAKPWTDEQILNRIAELKRLNKSKNNMSAAKIARWALDNIS